MNEPHHVIDIFLSYVNRYPRPDALYFKRQGKYRTISTSEFHDHVRHLAYMLMDFGIQPGDRVAILSENRPEWFYSDLGILAARGVDVPIYPTVPPDYVEYILKDSGSRGLFVSTMEQLDKAMKIAHAIKDTLEFIVSYEPLGDYRPSFLPTSIRLLDLEEALKLGKNAEIANPQKFRESVESIQPDHMATIIYTSGTTGQPKGVMLSHRNFVSNVLASLQVLTLKSSDIHLSFLPLCHSFERTAGFYIMLQAGVRIAFAENLQTVAENLLEIRPTVLLAVPRFYEKVKARLNDMQRSLTGVKKKIFTWAMRVANDYGTARRTGHRVSFLSSLKYRIADHLVFTKIRARTGGRLRIMVSGAAALPKEISEYFDNLGMRILEGYGLTETSPVISVNRENEWKPGSVGKAIPGVEVHIAEDGEILVRGPNIMMGYYKLPDETRAVMDEEGWLHTGDVGHMDEEGFIYITDRKKDILVTAGGKNIAPQRIESLLKQHPWIDEVMVVGDGKPYPAAFIVPNMEALQIFAKEHDIPTQSFQDLCDHPQVHEAFTQLLEKIQEPLAKFERVKRFALIPNPFTIEGGELTPTLKVRRKIVMQKYQDLFHTLYPEEG